MICSPGASECTVVVIGLLAGKDVSKETDLDAKYSLATKDLSIHSPTHGSVAVLG